jgi:hypothetical protein
LRSQETHMRSILVTISPVGTRLSARIICRSCGEGKKANRSYKKLAR